MCLNISLISSILFLFNKKLLLSYFFCSVLWKVMYSLRDNLNAIMCYDACENFLQCLGEISSKSYFILSVDLTIQYKVYLTWYSHTMRIFNYSNFRSDKFMITILIFLVQKYGTKCTVILQLKLLFNMLVKFQYKF